MEILLLSLAAPPWWASTKTANLVSFTVYDSASDDRYTFKVRSYDDVTPGETVFC